MARHHRRPKYNAFRIKIKRGYGYIKHVHGKWYLREPKYKKWRHYRRISKKKAANAYLIGMLRRGLHKKHAIKFFKAQPKKVLGIKTELPRADTSSIKMKQTQNEEQMQ